MSEMGFRRSAKICSAAEDSVTSKDMMLSWLCVGHTILEMNARGDEESLPEAKSPAIQGDNDSLYVSKVLVIDHGRMAVMRPSKIRVQER